MAFTKAKRTNAKLRLALTGTAGSGKTFSAIQLALGLGGKIAMIDTECGSGSLYAHLADYAICQLKPPYDPRRYVELIHEAENAGYNVIIIDSISHEWSGEGGCLDIQSKIANAKYRGNTYAAWRDVTPLHDSFVNTILSSPCHIIATMRSKTDYAMNENKAVQKVGLAPIQRDGTDYEFTTVLDISQNHMATVSKDRTGLFPDTPFIINPKVGEALLRWLNSGNVQDAQKGGEE